MSFADKSRSVRKWSHTNLLRDNSARDIVKGVLFFFSGEDIFVALKNDWKSSLRRSFVFSQHLKFNFFSTRNMRFSWGNFVSCCTNWWRQFQSGKSNFAALLCCFCKSTSFFPTDFLTFRFTLVEHKTLKIHTRLLFLKISSFWVQGIKTAKNGLKVGKISSSMYPMNRIRIKCLEWTKYKVQW